MTQKELIALLMPILKEKGKVYKKVKKIYAKRADGGERIITETADGPETRNVAEKGDFIVKNQTESQEQYIIEEEFFEHRYVPLEQRNDGYSEYRAIGKILAIKLNYEVIDRIGLGSTFYFTAKWGEEMIAKDGDFLVTPLNHSEIYRIARKEFFETYQIDD